MLFQEVRAIRSELGGTVNDVILTIIGGALGRYLRAHGERTDGVAARVMIPTNVRSEEEAGALGNRVSMMLADVSVGIEDGVARLEAVRSETARVKARNQSGAFESFLQMAENIPPPIQRLAGFAGVPGGTFNLVCTNVPGPMIPLYSVGHRMISFWGMLPLAADLGIGVAIGSYDKSLYLSIMSDPTIVDDVNLIRDFIDEEFQSLRKAAHVESAEPVEIQVIRPKRSRPSANGPRPRIARTKAPATSVSV
jgi:WS/DGAT/MGAT family acyltransferase